MTAKKLKMTSTKAIFVPDMKLPDFLIAEPPADTRGVNLIVCTKRPYAVGWVYQFRTEDEMAKFMANHPQMVRSKVNGYRILIKIANCLDEIGFMPTREELKTLDAMAAFYLESKVKPNAGYFKRYQEQSH